jgi:hypothetical protein
MNERKVKIIKKADAERREDNEKSLEVNYMLLLMQRHRDKAIRAAQKLIDKSAILT